MLFSIVIVFSLGFIVYELAKPTILPSFVLSIFFGIVSRDIFSFLVNDPASLTTLITIGAVLILFEGGIETPFTKFRALLGPILSLAIIGTFVNAFLLSELILILSNAFGLEIPLAAAVLLGSAIASTDPAAIIPSFKELFFTKPRVKHIAISESAINDVVGAVLVLLFITILHNTDTEITTPVEAFSSLLSTENLRVVLQFVLMGGAVGIVGYLILHGWSKWKERVQTPEGSDAALFLAVPLFAYTLAEVLGGSGFLAVFLCGLFFHIKSHFRHVEHYFNHTIEGFMKPMIFMLLGAMVDPMFLWEIKEMGIILGLIFMFVLRPIIVFLTLAPFCTGRNCMHIRELVFLSFVRETGVIPAALLITISVAGVPGHETITAIGLWIILMTLIIEPPLTPFLAKKLKLAKETSDLPERKHIGPVAVLCSRGYSFPERMKTVVDWANQHSVDNIALLHCPEEKFSQDFVNEVHHRAEDLFKAINSRLISEGKKEMNFEFLCGPGLLQDNIEKMIAEGDVSIIFVGSKMLDYRMSDVKRLNVPFYFMS